VLTAALAATLALGPGCTGGSAPPTIEGERLEEDDLVTTASTGETVVLDEHLEEGVFTVVEFYADW
jgi:hypothetical protein